MSKVYKWLPVDLVSKILKIGLSFSPASNFRDSSEFSINYKKHNIKDLINFITRYREQYGTTDTSRMLIQNILQNKATRKKLLKNLDEDEGEKFKKNLKKDLNDRYYICSLTYDDSLSFAWSDSSGNSHDQVRLTLNREKLEQQYKKMCQNVRYCDHRPAVNQTSPLEEAAYDVIFSKLKTDGTTNYEIEKEVRLAYCTERLNYDSELILSKKIDNEPYIYDLLLHDYLEEITVSKHVDSHYSKEWEEILTLKQDYSEQAQVYNQALAIINYLPKLPPIKSRRLLPKEQQTLSERAFGEYDEAHRFFCAIHTEDVVQEIFEKLAQGEAISEALIEMFKQPRYKNVPINYV